MTIDLQDVPSFRTPESNSLGTNQAGFSDPNGEFPRVNYFFEQSANKATRGSDIYSLEIGAFPSGFEVNLPPPGKSTYPYNDVLETRSGHIIQYDDTPGHEKIMIRHRTGSGVEIRSDGSVIVKTDNNLVQVVNGTSTILVEGDAKMKFGGNLNLSVDGDFNLDVGGNINISSGGNLVQTIKGSKRETVSGSASSTIKGSNSETILGANTQLSLGGLSSIVKGDSKNTINGNHVCSVSGSMKISSAGTGVMSSPNLNIAAENISVFGASGTIGGSGVVMHSATSYSDTFYGDLEGTSRRSITSDITNSQNYPGVQMGSANGYTVNLNSTQTARPDGEIVGEYLSNSGGGITNVQVDPIDSIRNSIDRTEFNGGVSSEDLNSRQVRQRLRNPENTSNSTFVGNAVRSGSLASSYSRPSPTGINRVSDGNDMVEATTSITSQNNNQQISPQQNANVSQFIPSVVLTDAERITENTLIGVQTRLSKFLHTLTESASIRQKENEERLKITRHLSMHASLYERISKLPYFLKNRIVIAEGLYTKGPRENVQPQSIAYFAMEGRSVAYEVYNSSGKIDFSKTFELAKYIKNNFAFDKLILSYDTYNPNGDMECQIVVIIPELNSKYEFVSGRAKFEVETQFNGNVQSSGLIEITNK